ncbi:unnamed protein product [marine sediment metagenome]|uniref:Glycosyltransferase 2-like domain-containing protein n=1 Tax=marine sediment metagenome TaxID=412755 RepID=X1BUS2_9ZZZZ
MKELKFALLIPAYNEALTIQSLVEECLHYSPHIVVVDDGSTDKTIHCLEGMPITILKNKKTVAKASALSTG